MINKWANYVHEYIYEGLQLNLHILYYVCYNNIWVDPGLNLVWVSKSQIPNFIQPLFKKKKLL